jgi:hypothetical protein
MGIRATGGRVVPGLQEGGRRVAGGWQKRSRGWQRLLAALGDM